MLAQTETFPSLQHGLVILAAIFVVFIAARAWTHGVLKMLWAIIGLSLGAASGVFFFQNSNALLTRWMPGKELGLNANIIGSAVIALVGYLLFRQLSKAILQKLFNPEGPLSGWAMGFRGAVISLVPSLITVAVVGLCLRMGGTLFELRRAELICAPDSAFVAAKYPKWPQTTQWRDTMESLPYVSDLYAVIDPVSRKTERTLVLLLIAAKNNGLRDYLQRSNSTLPIVNGSIFQALMSDSEIATLLAAQKHVALLRHPQVIAAASNHVIADLARTLDVHSVIDGYMLSESRQKMLRSAKGPNVPEF